MSLGEDFEVQMTALLIFILTECLKLFTKLVSTRD